MKKYSIPIYENNIKTKHTIDGIVGDEKYLKLIEFNTKGELPLLINIKVKNQDEKQKEYSVLSENLKTL